MRMVSPIAAGQQMPQRHHRADRPRLLRAGVRHAQVQRVIETLADLLVRVDHQQRVDALGADDDVVEILLLEDFQVLLQLGDHDRQEMAVLVVGKDAAQFLHAFLLVFAFDDGAFVDADANGDFRALQAWMTSFTWARSEMLPGLRRILWMPASMASKAR